MFGELSVLKILLVAVVVLVLFGRGKVSDFMGDFGKGVKSFKQGMAEESNVPPPPQIAPVASEQGTLNGDTVIDSSTNQPK